MFRTAALSVAALALPAIAGTMDAPVYDDYALYLRTNFAVNPGGSFNIPPNNFVNSETISMADDSANISVRIGVNAMGGGSCWAGTPATGQIVYSSIPGALMGSTSINESGRIVWNESFASPSGIYGVDLDTTNDGIITNRPLGASSWTAANVNDSGVIGYRATFSGAGTALVTWDDGVDTIVAAETGVDFMSPYSFLFTPSFNNEGRFAVKLRVGPGTSNSNPDEIRAFASDGSSVLLVSDRDGDPASPFSTFDNSVGWSDNGTLAFAGSLVEGNLRGVFVTDGTTVTTIATEDHPDISDIEFFAPDVNNSGVAVFRAFDSNGFRAIWAGNGDWLVRVVTEHDILPSDLGDARVDQETSSSPVFGGAPRITNDGRVGFNCGLTPPNDNQIEWGTAVFVAIPAAPAICPGDCDDNGTVEFADLVAMLFLFGERTEGPCDADGSKEVGFADLVAALFMFGPCPK